MQCAMKTLPPHIIGILWFILTGMLGVTINMAAKTLSTDMHAFQLVFFYNAAALPFFLLSRVAVGHRLKLKTDRLNLFTLRAILEFAGFSCLFYALSYLPLPAHTALGFTAPLFAGIAAIIFLNERLYIYQWIGLAAGMAGVLIITRPGFDGLPPQAWYVIAGAFCFGLCGVCIKKLTKTEPVSTVAFYMLLLTALLAAPFAYQVWVWPSATGWLWVAAIGALVFAVQHTVTQAVSRADITVLQPFAFLNLVWSSAYGYLLFDEVITGWTALGALIILSGTLYAIIHSRRANQRAAKLAGMGN